MNEIKYKDCIGTTTNGERVRYWNYHKQEYSYRNKPTKTLKRQLQAYKEKEDKLREYLKGLEKDNLKDLSEFEPKYIFESIIFALNEILKEGSNNEK